MKRHERLRRRDSFCRDAALYDALRPRYPGRILSEALELAGLQPGDRVLEVGCGTGQVTRCLADAGLRVVAVDRAEEMLDVARKRLGNRSEIELRLEDFERMAVVSVNQALFFATSYHWMDPDDRVARCRGHLVPGGALVLLWHVHPRPLTGFFERVQTIYERLLPDFDPPRMPGMVEEGLRAICEELQAGPFVGVQRRALEWTRAYTTDEYLGLLSTYSDHALLADGVRAALFAEVATLLDGAYGGIVVRPYRTELVVGTHAG